MSQLEHWEGRYATGHTPWETGHPSTELQRVLAAERVSPCRSIDLGCGSGPNSIWLAQQGFDVVGVDLSPLAIDKARQRAANAGVKAEFHAADLLQPPDLGAPFQFFLDRGLYHILRHVAEPRRYVEEVARLVAPGAHGLLLAGNAREPRQPGPPVVTEQELRAEWANGFEVLWLREIRFDPIPNEAVPPLGWSAWLQRSTIRT